MKTLVCAPSDQVAFEACKQRIEQLADQHGWDFPIEELKACPVLIERHKNEEGVHYLVVTISIEGWEWHFWVFQNKRGVVVVFGRGKMNTSFKTARPHHQGQPCQYGKCPVCQEKQQRLLQGYDASGRPIDDVRCSDCFNLPAREESDQSPLVHRPR